MHTHIYVNIYLKRFEHTYISSLFQFISEKSQKGKFVGFPQVKELIQSEQLIKKGKAI